MADRRRTNAPRLVAWLAGLIGIAVIGGGATALLAMQGAHAAAAAVRLLTAVGGTAWIMAGGFGLFEGWNAWRPTTVFIIVLGAGAVSAEMAARLGSVGAGLAVQIVAAMTAAWATWRACRSAPRWRSMMVGLAVTFGAAATIWFLARQGWLIAATGLTGITGMAGGCIVGFVAVRALLSGDAGVFGVARTVVDEAVRMRAPLVLVALLVLLIPTLPLVLDHSERLEYRIQFFLNWALGGTGLILSLLTIVLACGSVCGDIESNRIHMMLVKPLHRWEYLLGKWLGIVLFNVVMVALAGAGTYTFTHVLGSTLASDDSDREAVDRQVLTARVEHPPVHDKPREYEAAIDAAIQRLADDDPDGFALDPRGAARRIRHEYDWQWHTVVPDMVSTFVFEGLTVPETGADTGAALGSIQLQLIPRVNNVDVDLADVRFAMWINDRPWPMRDGRHVEQQMTSLAEHVLELPAESIDASGRMRLTIENRNLVPAGETRPTAITFPPGDGMKVYQRADTFTDNFLRCLAILWLKLAALAAIGIGAAACLGFHTAMLLAMVVFFAALGAGFLRDALGLYNVVADSPLAAIQERTIATLRFMGEGRFYEAWRMLLGFVADVTLAVVPAFSKYDAVTRLATGVMIPSASLTSCLLEIGLLYPIAVGAVAWVVFERRDLVRPLT